MPGKRPSSDIADLIVQVLQEQIRSRKRTCREVYDDYLEWCRNNQLKVEIGFESVRKWSLAETVPAKPGSFHDFALSIAEAPDKGRPAGMLANAVTQLFPSGDSRSTDKLKRLVGTFEMIRRLWLPADNDECLRSVITITSEQGVFVYRTRQQFVSQYPVDEADEGYVFLFGASFWIISHEQKQQSIKFLTVHECSPALTSDADTVELGRGNLVAVAGKGPNVSHPFIMRRIKREPFSTRILSREQTRSVFTVDRRFDRLSFYYLYNSNDKEETAPATFG